MKRLSMALAAALLAMFGMFAMGGAASATTYVTPPALTIVGCADVIDGAEVRITGLLPGSTVTVKWKNPSGSVRATVGADGTVTVFLPIKKAGQYTVTATGTAADGKAWTSPATVVNVVESCDGDDLGGVGDEDGDATGGESDTTGGTADETAEAGLASTGSDGNQGMLLALGLGALVIGGTTVLVARNRRWGSTDEA